MKSNKLFLIAAMLLTSVCMFAQSNNSEPLKGDVNDDGKVDVADIVAIIEIMKNGGGTSGETTTYYYYVGITKPTSSMVPSASADGWNVIEQGSTQIIVNSEFLVPDRTWYVAIPHSYGYQAYDTEGAEPEPNGYNVSQITINNILYDLFATANYAYAVFSIFKV